MQISIVVPSYNEGHRIRATIDAIAAFCERELTEWEVIIVDDGSSDATSATAAAKDDRVKLLRNSSNSGKGFSVRRGILEAKYDPVLFTDADLSTPIEESLLLLEAIRAGADVAIGVRTPTGGRPVRRPLRRKLMALGFRLLVKALVLRGFHDTQNGFKMFRRDAARRIFSLQRLDRWGFDVEVLYLARREGMKIAQVPVAYTESSESRLRLVTPLTMIRDLLQVRWNALVGKYSRGGIRAPRDP
ncbi:MAG TPA: glycosyltransferase [Planctomycetota bacterium]|nr:glycosyltransferase [Planctomycetota bacterium]